MSCKRNGVKLLRCVLPDGQISIPPEVSNKIHEDEKDDCEDDDAHNHYE